ncbi:MAG: sigma factor [Limisphaerales bacterium]
MQPFSLLKHYTYRRQLFDKCCPEILRYVYHSILDHAVAEDLTSNVFFPAFRRLGLFRSWRIPFRAWLYRDRHRLRHWRSRPRVSPAFPLKLLYPSVQ